MAVTGTNLDPSAVLEWNATNYNLVRQIETTDAVLGGNATRPDPANPLTEVVLNSAVNHALATLAARTKWLKKEVERLEAISVPDKATTAEAKAGTNDTAYMTPKKVADSQLKMPGVHGTPSNGQIPKWSNTNSRVEWQNDNSGGSYGAASTSIYGVIRLATNSQVDTGTDSLRATTPAGVRRATGPQVSATEKTAGTVTAVRRFSPKDVKDMAQTFSNVAASNLDWKPSNLNIDKIIFEYEGKLFRMGNMLIGTAQIWITINNNSNTLNTTSQFNLPDSLQSVFDLSTGIGIIDETKNTVTGVTISINTYSYGKYVTFSIQSNLTVQKTKVYDLFFIAAG